MVIHPSGLFDHVAVLRRDDAGVWRGRADSNQQQDTLVGDEPRIKLIDGMLTLVRTEFEWPGAFRRDRDPLAGRVSFRVGPALEAVLDNEDTIRMLRHGTGDLAVTLARNGQVVMALGAVDRLVAPAGIRVDTDPRASDLDFYGIAHMAGKPDVRLVWLDVDDRDLESRVEEIQRPPQSVKTVIAVARTGDRSRLRDLNDRVFAGRSHASLWYQVAPERIRSQDDLMTYLRHLPKTRPDDLCLRFTIDGRSSDVREGEYRSHDPWHLFVAKVFTPGMPGELSQLGVAHTDPNLSVDTFTSSVRQIAGSSINFDA